MYSFNGRFAVFSAYQKHLLVNYISIERKLLMVTNGTHKVAVSPEERLLERLKDPKTARQLELILDKLDLVAFSLTALDGFLRRSDEIVEAVTDGIADLNRSLPEVTIGSTRDTVEHVKDLFQVSVKLKEVLSSPEFDALMASGILSPQTVSIVGKAGDALTESYQAPTTPPQKIGIFGLLRLLNDPDVQRSLNLLITFAKNFGRKINA